MLRYFIVLTTVPSWHSFTRHFASGPIIGNLYMFTGLVKHINLLRHMYVFLLVCFVALRPKSIAMVIAGRSVHLTTLFSWESLNK